MTWLRLLRVLGWMRVGKGVETMGTSSPSCSPSCRTCSLKKCCILLWKKSPLRSADVSSEPIRLWIHSSSFDRWRLTFTVPRVAASKQAQLKCRGLPPLRTAIQSHGRYLQALWGRGTGSRKQRENFWEHHGPDAAGDAAFFFWDNIYNWFVYLNLLFMFSVLTSSTLFWIIVKVTTHHFFDDPAAGRPSFMDVMVAKLF